MDAVRVDADLVTGAGVRPRPRHVADEVPVALVHDGVTHAVMMASPGDPQDFAVGFALTEGVITAPDQIRDIEVVPGPLGVEVRLWLHPGAARAHLARRRQVAGPTGCGLCGVDSLEAAVPPPPAVPGAGWVTPAEVQAALTALATAQALGTLTRATHAAAFWDRTAGLGPVREDVGRHNALDKLVGALVRAGRGAADGMVLITSRVSVEMVQKTARLGAPILVAVSAPTTLAIRTADAAGLTLIGVARADGFEIFTHPGRVRPAAADTGTPRHVA